MSKAKRTAMAPPKGAANPERVKPEPVVSAPVVVSTGAAGLAWVRPLVAVLAVMALLYPVWYYYRVVWQSAFNFPFEDDFDSPMRFINSFMAAGSSATERLKLLVAQHNEHRIVFDRLVFLGQYALEGAVDLRTCILIGNTSLLCMLALLYRVSFRSLPVAYRLLALVPVGYALFTLHFWELTVWGMASLQNLYVLVFVMVSLFSLSKTPENKRLFGQACAFAVLAAYTSGNGLFIFPVGAAVLLYLRQTRPLLIWLGLGLLTALTYFWGYTSPAAHPSVYDSLVNNTSRAVDYFFTLTGSVFAANSLSAGHVFLLLYLTLAAYLIKTKQLRTYLPLFSFLTFLYLTAGVLMATRSGFGVGQAFSPRYGILSVLLFASLGILWTDALRSRNAKVGVGLVFGLLSVYLFMTINDQNEMKTADRKRLLQFASAFFNNNPQDLLVFRGEGEAQKQGQAILRAAIAQKTYAVPAVTLADLASAPVAIDRNQIQPSTEVSADVRPVDMNGYLVFWNAWAVLSGFPSHRVQVEVVAQSSTNAYAFATGKHMRYDVANQLQSEQFAESGFSAVVQKKALTPGTYALWLRLISGSTQAYLPLNQSVVIN